MTVFGVRDFKEEINIKLDHKGGPWSDMTGVPIRRGCADTDTHGGKTK